MKRTPGTGVECPATLPTVAQRPNMRKIRPRHVPGVGPRNQLPYDPDLGLVVRLVQLDDHVQCLLGHGDPKLTAQIYTHLDIEDLRGAVEGAIGS